jgi:hypothetical protein
VFCNKPSYMILTFSCHCSTLHVSAYMAIFRCVCFTFIFLKESASLLLLPFLVRGYTIHVLICVVLCSVRQQGKARKPNTHTRIRKLTKTQQKNTNEKLHSITTCKKGQQKQRSRFLQEYKSETSYTLEDGHVGQNM